MSARPLVPGDTGRRVAAGVKALRQARGWSLGDVARRMNIDGARVYASTISKIETGDRRVDVDDLVKLGRIFGVDPSELLTFDATNVVRVTVSALRAEAERLEREAGLT